VLCGGRGVRLDASSEVRSARLFVCLELDAGRRGTHAEALVRSASAVERAWLDSTRLREEVRTTFDPATERIAARRTTLYEDLVLDETSVRPSAETAEAALLEAALADPERALDLAAEEFGQLRLRLAFLAGVMPELEFPRIDEALLADALRTLCQGRRSFSELRKAPLVDTLAALLGWQTTQALDRLAPTHATIPSGRRVRLVYREEGPPVLAARIQELFGMAEAPCIADGRARLVVHLLAPNGRPAQVTDDLASFWNSGYAEVRKELRRRYPRHAWPEDPREAPAVRPGRPR
jgi:ATP-dependent helicase HrpB